MRVHVDATGASAWWSTPPAGWPEASDAIFNRWHRFDRSSPRLDDEVALAALSFGYGARAVFGEHKLWADLAVLLEADWRLLDGDEHPWADVQKVVKEGWTAAASNDPIRGESMVAEPLPVEPPVELNVPGGRPDRRPLSGGSTTEPK